MSWRDPIVIPSLPTVGRLIQIPPFAAELSDQVIGQSQLGTPVYSNLIFEPDVAAGVAVSIVLDDALLEVYQPRNIIKTMVAGRSGSVKEYISDGDFEVMVRGALVSPNRSIRPTDVMEEMVKLFKLEREIKVSSNFWLPFNITDVVVVNYRFWEVAGFYNMIPFEITMLSDEPVEIKANDIQTF
jgi:hypothetical protein